MGIFLGGVLENGIGKISAHMSDIVLLCSLPILDSSVNISLHQLLNMHNVNSSVTAAVRITETSLLLTHSK